MINTNILISNIKKSKIKIKRNLCLGNNGYVIPNEDIIYIKNRNDISLHYSSTRDMQYLLTLIHELMHVLGSERYLDRETIKNQTDINIYLEELIVLRAVFKIFKKNKLENIIIKNNYIGTYKEYLKNAYKSNNNKINVCKVIKDNSNNLIELFEKSFQYAN